MFKIIKNRLAKEAFYKSKCQEGLKELNEILKNIESKQAETQRLKKQTAETRKRIELSICRFEN